MHGGKLNDSQWGKRFSGEGIFAEQIRKCSRSPGERRAFASDDPKLSTAAFRRAGEAQLSLFGGI